MILEDYEALKCRYPSKKCWNQRAVKRNGERHNLCEMHRQKANNNQRRLDKKRKAGHMLKGEPGSGESDAPEFDYHAQAALAQQHHHHQHQQQHMHHPYSRPAPHQHPQHLQQQQQQQLLLQQHLPQHLSLLQRQQAMAQHYHQQQEKRLRVSLTNMYAAAQALSPHGHSPSSTTHARELAPLRPSSVSSLPTAPRPVLHLPPLTAHIPSIAKTSSRSSSPQTVSSSSLSTSPLSRSSSVNLSTTKATPTTTTTTSPQLVSKPTILLPPITSVPRCHQSPFQLPLAGGAASSASWSLRSEEKAAHLA